MPVVLTVPATHIQTFYHRSHLQSAEGLTCGCPLCSADYSRYVFHIDGTGIASIQLGNIEEWHTNEGVWWCRIDDNHLACKSAVRSGIGYK